MNQIIEGAREAAFDAMVLWDDNPDAPKSAAETASECADAAVRVVLEHLRNVSVPGRAFDNVIAESYVELFLEELDR